MGKRARATSRWAATRWKAAATASSRSAPSATSGTCIARTCGSDMALHLDHHHRAVENLVYEWARAIDENRVEAICELLRPDGRYTVQSRFNADRGLPHALMDAQSAAQLRDRIKSMRLANIYEPQHYRHIVSGVQIVGGDASALQVRSNFLVVRTLALDGDMKLFDTGQC